MVLGEGGGEDVLGRGKGTFPLEPRAVLWSAEAKAEPSLYQKPSISQTRTP